MARTVKEIKDKMLDHAYSIDIAKLTLTDLHTFSSVLKSISEIREEGDDYWAKMMQMISETTKPHKPASIGDLKEGEYFGG